MDENKKKELHNLFRLIFATKINSEKYSKVTSYDELNNLLENTPEEKSQVEAMLGEFTDEELLEIASKLQESEKEKTPISAKKGAYLKKLKKYSNKCKCGCDLIQVKGEGGKMIKKCSCGCKNE